MVGSIFGRGRRLGIWKMAIPPAVVPLALGLFVALAGPGGPVEVGNDMGSTTGGGGPREYASAAAGFDVSGDTDGEGDTDADGDTDGESDTEPADVTGHDGEEKGCETALTEKAQSRTQLEEHVADSDAPDGKVDGNQNALDYQCGGAFAEDSPGAAEGPAEESASDPGKSEHATGGPMANGQANGQGQSNADENGNGLAGTPGRNEQ